MFGLMTVHLFIMICTISFMKVHHTRCKRCSDKPTSTEVNVVFRVGISFYSPLFSNILSFQ